MLICKGCNQEREIDDFYRHAAMASGRLSFCKECVKARVKAHRMANLERVQAYDRDRSSLPHRVSARAGYQKSHRGLINKLSAEWRARNKEKRVAHLALGIAVKSGKIVKPEACQRCGGEFPLEGHHSDHSKPLEVEWLCRLCHVGLHREEVTEGYWPRHIR